MVANLFFIRPANVKAGSIFALARKTNEPSMVLALFSSKIRLSSGTKLSLKY